jgi:pimeloyl-ACP methyl ester carboxylesterase
MNAPARHSLSLSDGNISYLEWPADGPVLHFAHATGFNAETYVPLLAPLSDDLRILASDARGHGLTGLPTAPGMARDWAIYREDLARFLEATTNGPVVLAGHSMGATVSAMIAARFPDRVSGLILIEPVLIPHFLRLLRWIPFRPRASIWPPARSGGAMSSPHPI